MNKTSKLLILSFLLIFSCKNKTQTVQDNQTEVNSVNYQLKYDSSEKYPGWPGGRSLIFGIENEYTSDELNLVADSIVNADNGLHPIIAINWMHYKDFNDPIRTSTGLYATSLYMHEELITTTKEQSKEYYKVNPDEGSEKEVKGAWHDNVINAEIYMNKLPSGDLSLEYLYGFGRTFEIPIKKEKLNGKIIYTIPGDNGGFLFIDKEGVLRVYDRSNMKNIFSYSKAY